MSADYDLILTFDDQSPSFTFGFQAGVIWEKMKRREEFTEQFCGDILELVQRMPARTNYRFEIEPAEETGAWYNLRAIPL